MATNFSQSRKSNKQSRNKKPRRSARNNAFYLPTPEAKDEDADDYFLRVADATNVFNHYGAFEINKPTQSTEVHRSTPFPLKNALSISQVSNPFALLSQAVATDDADASRTAVNDSNDSDEYASSDSESSRTATFSDDRCRHVADEYIVDLDEQHSDDVQPTKSSNRNQQNKNRKKMVLTDNNSTVTHSGHRNDNTFTYTPHHILSINQRSLSASEYSSTSPHITTHITAYNTPINTYHGHGHGHTTPLNTYYGHNTNTSASKYSSRSMNMGLIQSDSNICIAPDEMDEDFYDLLSDAVCSLFTKLDTRNKKAVSYDIIQIGFTLLDINLTEPQFNIFINELSNFRAHKMIKLDMLRSFILNIQNKTYNYKLKQIRLILIDGLLSQPICRSKVLNLSKISRKYSLQSDLSKVEAKHLQTMSTFNYNISTLQSSENNVFANKKRPNNIVLTVSRNNHKKLNKPHFKKDSNIWRAHITDHDANGACQYDLLLCTLKYSLISTAVDLYNTDSLDINDDKFYIYIKNQAQKQALQYLLESFFHFMGNYAEFMSLKCFEAGLKTCGITFDRKDISIISFGQLSTAFTGSGSKNVKKQKKAKLFITKNSFVAWLIDMIYSQQNRNYKNYTKHYHQYYKWIENDLFSLVNPGRVGHNYKNKKNKQIIHEMDGSHHHSDPSSHSIISMDNKYNHIHHRQVPDVATKRKKHKSQHYHNPVIMPKPKKKQKHRKRRHKSQQIQIQHRQIRHHNFNKYLDMV